MKNDNIKIKLKDLIYPNGIVKPFTDDVHKKLFLTSLPQTEQIENIYIGISTNRLNERNFIKKLRLFVEKYGRKLFVLWQLEEDN